MAISPQRLTIYLYSAHRAVIFAIAQLSCYLCVLDCVAFMSVMCCDCCLWRNKNNNNGFILFTRAQLSIKISFHQLQNFSTLILMNRTEPEFSSGISKSSGVLSKVAIEKHSAVLTSLKHLQHTQEARMSLRKCAHIVRKSILPHFL